MARSFITAAAGSLLILAVCCVAIAQTPDQPLRVDVNLVQIDAIVTDKSGRHVTNLTKDDFELLENGVSRPLTYFNYVSLGPPSPARGPAASGGPLALEDVRRTLALVVDDLRLSPASLHYTKEALGKFIDQQLEPGDLAAVITTSGQLGHLQQFTTDRRQLRLAIDRLHPQTLPAGGGMSEDMHQRNFQIRNFNLSSLQAVRAIARGLRDFPGRKSLIMFSEGFEVGIRARRNAYDTAPDTEVFSSEILEVAQAVHRSSAVLYAIDPRGVAAENILAVRRAQAGFAYLATESGGRAAFDTNDLNQSLARVLADQSGYYLLGYVRPSAEGQAPSAPPKITLRLKTGGYEVRYRKAALGLDEPTRKPATNAELLADAIAFPFSRGKLQLRFTPTFTLNERSQPIVKVLLHIDAGAVEFTPPDSQGQRTARLHIALAAQGGGRNRVPPSIHSYDIRLKPDAFERQKQGGFVYALEQAIPQPGPYQLHVAVLDEHSREVGSAHRFVEIPDVRKGRVALSGITMQSGDWRKGAPLDELSPAIREFTRGEPFSYGLTVYNPPRDPKTGQPSLQLQPRLIAQGKIVWEGKPIAVIQPPGAPPDRLPAGGTLTLGSSTTPGPYILELQVIKSDAKVDTIAEWTDFQLRD